MECLVVIEIENFQSLYYQPMNKDNNYSMNLALIC